MGSEGLGEPQAWWLVGRIGVCRCLGGFEAAGGLGVSVPTKPEATSISRC